MSVDELKELVLEARRAAREGDLEKAIATQETAVAQMRQMEETQDTLVTLSVLLHNLAGYYQDAERYEEAVPLLEEVVALDERTRHPDLEADRRVLEQARRVATMTPEERAELETAVRQAAVRLTSMSESDQEMARTAVFRQAIRALADDVRDAAIAARQGQQSADALAGRIQVVMEQVQDEDVLGRERQQLVDYLQAVIALLKGQTVPSVSAAYADHVAAIRAAKPK